MRVAFVVVVIALTTGCGTYSMMRPADTLPKGRFELAAGLAASQLGEVNTVIHAAAGVTDHVEVLAQNELWNTFGEVRYGITHSKDHQVAVAVGAGGGRVVTFLSALTSDAKHETTDGAAAEVSVAAGRTWDRAALTLGNRTFLLRGDYMMSSTRLGFRFNVAGPLGVLVEVGGTAHVPFVSAQNGESLVTLWIGEATFGFSLGF